MPLPNITLTGNLTSDPELKYVSNGSALARFRVACSERRKDASGQWVDGITTYIDVTAWRDLAEAAAANLTKGSKVAVIGKLKMNTYTAKDGTERTAYEVDAQSVAAPLLAATTTTTITPEDPF